MKHIIEKHVIIPKKEGLFKDIGLIRHQDFPALISNLEAEMCKFAEWCEAGYGQFRDGQWQDEANEWLETKTTAELLKIYQEQRNLEGKPL